MTKTPRKSSEISVYAGLFLFGALYNALIGWLERKRMLEGFTAYAVAFGVVVTLGGVMIKDRKAAGQAFLGFVASGTPMILGATWRYAQARAREQAYVRTTEAMAVRRKSST